VRGRCSWRGGAAGGGGGAGVGEAGRCGDPYGEARFRESVIGAIGALMNRVRQPRPLVVLGLNVWMGTAAGADESAVKSNGLSWRVA